MYVKIKEIGKGEYIVYLMSDTDQPLKATIIKADLKDKVWD
tara:strand:- start:4680 stop:4802 length:123 start_codon:yes stop_codon:yes gene_type:complete